MPALKKKKRENETDDSKPKMISREETREKRMELMRAIGDAEPPVPIAKGEVSDAKADNPVKLEQTANPDSNRSVSKPERPTATSDSARAARQARENLSQEEGMEAAVLDAAEAAVAANEERIRDTGTYSEMISALMQADAKLAALEGSPNGPTGLEGRIGAARAHVKQVMEEVRASQEPYSLVQTVQEQQTSRMIKEDQPPAQQAATSSNLPTPHPTE